MGNRSQVVMLANIYVLVEIISEEQEFYLVYITANRGASVIDAGIYQKCLDAYFLIHLDGQWYKHDSPEALKIMERHWREDNP